MVCAQEHVFGKPDEILQARHYFRLRVSVRGQGGEGGYSSRVSLFEWMYLPNMRDELCKVLRVGPTLTFINGLLARFAFSIVRTQRSACGVERKLSVHRVGCDRIQVF